MTRTATLQKPEVRMHSLDAGGDYNVDVLLPSGWYTSAAMICPHHLEATGNYRLVVGRDAAMYFCKSIDECLERAAEHFEYEVSA